MDWSIIPNLKFNHIANHDEPQPFYGVVGHQFKLGDHVWEAVAFEDPEGSTILKEVIRVDDSTAVFPDEPLAYLCVAGQHIHEFNKAYSLYDPVDNFIWLKIYTKEWFWEPTMVFEYTERGAPQCLRTTTFDA